MKLKISILGIAVVAISVLFSASNGNVWADFSSTGVMIYKPGNPIDDSNFVDVTSQIEDLGGTVLEGNTPTIKIRFDSPPDPDATTAHGVFEQLNDGPAKIQIVFPFDEHMQVLHGVLKITDSAGTVYYLSPGDSYFIAQGSVILWEVLTPVFQKSFHDFTHQ
jgi:uncharacterized cupin superfamily protein